MRISGLLISKRQCGSSRADKINDSGVSTQSGTEWHTHSVLEMGSRSSSSAIRLRPHRSGRVAFPHPAFPPPARQGCDAGRLLQRDRQAGRRPDLRRPPHRRGGLHLPYAESSRSRTDRGQRVASHTHGHRPEHPPAASNLSPVESRRRPVINPRRRLARKLG